MKRIQLIGVNAKFSHTCLAVRCLRAAAPFPMAVTEVTINESIQHSAALILSDPADIYCFSCTIWNLETILKLAELVRLNQPDCEIFFGGPEVSYDAPALLEKYDFVDGIFCGEGERSFALFCQAAAHDSDYHGIPGLQLRGAPKVALQIISDPESYPFPYTSEELIDLKNRILYYESMRGCPFQCAYCLSSTLPGGVRCLSLDRVRHDLQRFIDGQVRQVKFVDRTFNLFPERAKAIFEFLAAADTETNFHFEMAADLLDDDMMSVIAKAPPGRFQFEIGIQSTDQTTLKAITRQTDLDRVKQRIRQLLALGNAHIHVDLIAGLPHEDFVTFRRSFNETIALRPHMLQLGFLKLLKGTAIRRNAGDHGYRFASFPPYEVTANDYITAEEMRQLKEIEALTELYYNSGAFTETMDYLFNCPDFESPFDFFLAFSAYWHSKGYHLSAHSKEQLYAILGHFYHSVRDKDLLWDLLAYDAFSQGMKHLPAGIPDHGRIKKEAGFDIAGDDFFIGCHFPDLIDFAPKKRIKYLVMHRFSPSFADYMGEGGTIGVFYQGQSAFMKEVLT